MYSMGKVHWIFFHQTNMSFQNGIQSIHLFSWFTKIIRSIIFGTNKTADMRCDQIIFQKKKKTFQKMRGTQRLVQTGSNKIFYFR